MLKAYKQLRARLKIYREFVKSKGLIKEYLNFKKQRK